MPIFEYRCRKCSVEFEKLVFGDKRVECPECGDTDVEKLFSVFASVIAGGGKSTGSSCGSCKASPSKCKSCH